MPGAPYVAFDPSSAARVENTPVIGASKVMLADTSRPSAGSKKMYQDLPSGPVCSSMKKSVFKSTWPWPTGVGLLYSANETPGVRLSTVGSAAWATAARQKAATPTAKRLFIDDSLFSIFVAWAAHTL